MRADAPVMLCREKTGPKGKSWVFKCPHCRIEHIHGPMPGHREAHCIDFSKTGKRLPPSPYRETGYILKLAPKS